MAIMRNGKKILNTTEGAVEADNAAVQAVEVKQEAQAAEVKQVQTEQAAEVKQAQAEQPESASDIQAASRMSEKDFALAEERENAAMEQEPTARVRIPLISKTDPYVDVGVNGVIKRIQRGVTLDLPQSIVEVLEHAEIL